MNEPKGFIQPYIEDSEFIFGGEKVPKEVLVEDGQWTPWLPPFEPQRKNTETSNCTGFNTLNCLEAILKKKYGVEKDYSDRALGIVAGTYPPGNSPQKVADSIRKRGLLDENYLPFDPLLSVDEYYAPNPLPYHLDERMKQWLAVYDFSHEWVFTPFFKSEEKINNLKECLRYSPIGISVYAWVQNGESLYYKPDGAQDNHWTLLCGYKDGEYWLVYDSYEERFKKLVWQYPFEFAKRFFVSRKTLETTGKKVDIIQWLLSFFKNLWK